MGRHALTRFRRFLDEERGLPPPPPKPLNPQRLLRYQADLPAWLVDQLTRYQQIRQVGWRPARLTQATVNFWNTHTCFWRWFCARQPLHSLADVDRAHIHAFIDDQLAAKYSVKSINLFVQSFQSTLRFLQERGHSVPQALLRRANLRPPDDLPRFLPDEQVGRLQAAVEQRVDAATAPARRRDALLDRAFFYLLWQAGLRVSEVEDLQQVDLNLPGRQLTVRRGKGGKDRTVYLTPAICAAVDAYLVVRGSAAADHVFLYRHAPLPPELVANRIRAAGKRAKVRVTPHMLRHTFATQLVNAGCPITTIQQLLGHKRLATTLIYTRVHNRTVADDYFRAMESVEQRLAPPETAPEPETSASSPESIDVAPLLDLAEQLADPLPAPQQALVAALWQGLVALRDGQGRAAGRPREVRNAEPAAVEWLVAAVPS